MRLLELMASPAGGRHASPVQASVVVGVVTNNQDDEGLGRVKVRFPWLSDEDESHWARVATPMAGNERGMYFLPEVDDEVLVCFEHGDLRFPVILGSLWNGKDVAPANNEDGNNNIRLIRSRSGHVIRLNDEDGAETIEIVDKSEANSIVIDTASNTITITADADVVVTAPQGTVKIETDTLEVKSSADVKIEAGGNMDLKAGGTMTIEGSTVNIN